MTAGHPVTKTSLSRFLRHEKFSAGTDMTR